MNVQNQQKHFNFGIILHNIIASNFINEHFTFAHCQCSHMWILFGQLRLAIEFCETFARQQRWFIHLYDGNDVEHFVICSLIYMTVSCRHSRFRWIFTINNLFGVVAFVCVCLMLIRFQILPKPFKWIATALFQCDIYLMLSLSSVQININT